MAEQCSGFGSEMTDPDSPEKVHLPDDKGGDTPYHRIEIDYGVEIWDKETARKFEELEKIGIEKVEMNEPTVRGCDRDGNTWHDRIIHVTTKDGGHHEICDSWTS